MRPCVTLALVLSWGSIAVAQDHLIPDTGVLADPDEYRLRVHHVFKAAFEWGVIGRVVSDEEFVVGLRRTDQGFEAFRLEASSSIFDTVRLLQFERGEIEEAGPDGGAIPLEKNREYQALKKRTPADYRTIKAVEMKRPIPEALTDDIWSLWNTMLLGVRHPEKPINVLHGPATCYYSAFIFGRGEVSGHSGDAGTGPSLALAKVTERLDEYVRGKCDEAVLTKALADAKAVIKPRTATRQRGLMDLFPEPAVGKRNDR